MRITKKLMKARTFFRRNVCEYLESVGAVAKPCDFAREYLLETPVGRLTITVFDNWIACCFADPKAAAARVPSNPYSGKWNFHYADDAGVLNNGLVIGNFVLALEGLLAATADAT